VQSIVYSVPYTVESIQYTVRTIQYTVLRIQYTVHIIEYTVYSTEYTVYIKQYREYSTQYTLYSIQYTLNSAENTVFTIQYTLHSIQHTIYIIQYGIYVIQYTVYTVSVQLYVGITTCINFYIGRPCTTQQHPPPVGHGPPHYRCFPIALRHTTVGRTPLDEWSARRRDLYLTTHNTHNRQTSIHPGGIRTRNLSKPATADPRLRPRGHRGRLFRSRQLMQGISFSIYIYLLILITFIWRSCQ
jgi:hypothetical protein